MRTFSSVVLCCLLTCMASSQPSLPQCPLPGEWTLREDHSDEFDGMVLDAGKWWDFNPSWVGRRPAYFDRANVRVQRGFLELTARAQDSASVTVENRARGMDLFSTAIVKGRKRVMYGYFEARSKAMRAGVCNAFWLYDPLEPDRKYREGDASEEIDIFEVFGKLRDADQQRIFWATVHRYETPYVESLVNKKKTRLSDYSFRRQMPYDFYEDFHVFGLWWTPEFLVWYVDGEEVYRRPNDYFHRPLYVVLDAEIMEDWMGLPVMADLPAVFYTDYVRVWQQR